MEEETKFKHLLEYFVAHLEYVQGGQKDTSRGYEYIQNCKKKYNDFMLSGQGYLGHNIQRQIERWDTYDGRRVCISVQSRPRLQTVATYLHWEHKYTKIIADWNEARTSIVALKIMYPETFRLNEKNGREEPVWIEVKESTLKELGLDLEPSSNSVTEELRQFLEEFKRAYNLENAQ